MLTKQIMIFGRRDERRTVGALSNCRSNASFDPLSVSNSHYLRKPFSTRKHMRAGGTFLFEIGRPPTVPKAIFSVYQLQRGQKTTLQRHHKCTAPQEREQEDCVSCSVSALTGELHLFRG